MSSDRILHGAFAQIFSNVVQERQGACQPTDALDQSRRTTETDAVEGAIRTLARSIPEIILAGRYMSDTSLRCASPSPSM
jgi:hypothetical protein